MVFAMALSRSPNLSKLYFAHGNGGTASIAENVPLDPKDTAACADWATSNAIDLTIIGPEDPLCAGIVDVFSECGLPVFGPSAAAARIEGSKLWSKELMQRAGVPTADAAQFTDYAAASAWVKRRAETGGAFPLVVKADGLAAGKGVIIAQDEREAQHALAELMRDATLGAAGANVLI